MDKIKLLWEYQTVDAELDTITAKLRSCPERKILSEAKAYILEAKENMTKIESNADRILDEMTKLEKEQELLMKRFGQIGEKLEQCESEEEVDGLRREIRRVTEDLAGVEKSVSDLIATANNLKKKYAAYASNGSKKRKEYDENKNAYDAIKAEVDKEAAGVLEKLKGMEKELDPVYLKEYKRIKGNRPNPLAILKGNRCTGCNMELPPIVAKKVAAADEPVECENCGRILIIL